MGMGFFNHLVWMINASFAAHAWNAAPVNRTDVVRSFAAKARHFHFPLNVAEPVERIVGSLGEHTLQHIETMFPLWFKQKELLKLLTEERRQRHTDWVNKHRKQQVFNPGDLVVIRRQVTSDASAGRPAKLRVRARGPYRVLEKAGDDSHWVQRLPVLPGMNQKLGAEFAMPVSAMPSASRSATQPSFSRMSVMAEAFSCDILSKLGAPSTAGTGSPNPGLPKSFAKLQPILASDVWGFRYPFLCSSGQHPDAGVRWHQ